MRNQAVRSALFVIQLGSEEGSVCPRVSKKPLCGEVGIVAMRVLGVPQGCSVTVFFEVDIAKDTTQDGDTVLDKGMATSQY